MLICICNMGTLHVRRCEYLVLCHLYFSLSDQRDSPVVTKTLTLVWKEQ